MAAQGGVAFLNKEDGMTSVTQCASIMPNTTTQCDQINGHYPTTSHHAVQPIDDAGNTNSWYWDDAEPGG